MAALVSGSWISWVCDDLAVVVDQGSGSTSWICSLELGVSFAGRFSSFASGNGFS